MKFGAITKPQTSWVYKWSINVPDVEVAA